MSLSVNVVVVTLFGAPVAGLNANKSSALVTVAAEPLSV